MDNDSVVNRWGGTDTEVGGLVVRTAFQFGEHEVFVLRPRGACLASYRFGQDAKIAEALTATVIDLARSGEFA